MGDPEIRETFGNGIGFEPLRQLGGFTLRRLPDVATAGGVFSRIAGENPLRQLLVAYPTDASLQYAVRPVGGGTTGFPPSSIVAGMVVIHAAALPLLCQGQWFAAATAAAVFQIFEVYDSSS